MSWAKAIRDNPEALRLWGLLNKDERKRFSRILVLIYEEI